MNLKEFIKNLSSQSALSVDLESDKNFNDNLIKYFEDEYKIYIIDVSKCYSVEEMQSLIFTLKEKYPDPSNAIIILNQAYQNNNRYTSMLYMQLVNMNYKIIIDSNIVSSQSYPVQNRVINLSKDKVFSMMQPEVVLDKYSVINRMNCAKESLSPTSQLHPINKF